jgi:tripartite-type tricarboxylate transporter receptor subunit TctC
MERSLTWSGRRTLLGAVGGLSLAPRARAQGGYPGSRPITIVMPSAPGGVPDVLGNLMTRSLAQRLGGSAIMEHRPGAATSLAARHVARARPDGYTLLLATNATFAVLPFAMRNPGFDPLADFDHVAMMANSLYMLVAHPRWRGLEDVVAAARREPGRLNYATWGVGSLSHLGMVDFMRRAGIEMVHVPYNGAPPALTDTVAGQIDVMMSTLAPAKALIESGRLRALGAPSEARVAAAPGVPTLIEQGYAGFTVGGWLSISAPAGTPPEILATLEAVALDTFRDPAVAAHLSGLGVEAAPLGRAGLRDRIAADLVLFQDLCRRAGIQPE